LEEASHVVRRCKEATGNVEPAEGYKKNQIKELKKEAAAQHGNDGQPNQHDSEGLLSG